MKAGVADTDAVNVSQQTFTRSNRASSSVVTTVTVVTTLKVTPTVNGNTHDYKVSLADDVLIKLQITQQISTKNTNDIKISKVIYLRLINVLINL